MGALAGLFLLGLLFLGHAEQPKCPSLHLETINHYQTRAFVTYEDGTVMEGERTAGGWEFQNDTKKKHTLGSVYVESRIASTSPNLDAIEYNKRVEDCQTKNGEF